MMNADAKKILADLLDRRSELIPCRSSLEAAFTALAACFRGGNKLLICGNGGSAADSEHIVGELMKGFRSRRPLTEAGTEPLRRLYGEEGEKIALRLQGALPAISLVSQVSLCTAIANDVAADMIFAQQVYGYGRRGDALIAISTSGGAANAINAVKVARALEMRTIALTGTGGTLGRICEITIGVPGTDTAAVQEHHMAVYHGLCAALEAELFPA